MTKQDDFKPIQSLLIGLFFILGPLATFLMLEIGILPSRAEGDSAYVRGSYIGGIIGSVFSVLVGVSFLILAFKQRLEQRAANGETSLLLSMNSIKISPLMAIGVLAILFVLSCLIIPLFMAP